ncbi:MAG: sensor histidine kinase [Butyrivibrio sp.]|nr:sensor histidine kinase [Acetatifactor muris]MCM1559314.1 sensor histidine kinase [Butyrivibrio sp.]
MNKSHRPGRIQKKILVITVSCLLGMCVLISFVSYYLFQNYLQHSLIQSTETNLRLLSDTMDGNLNDIYRMVRFCQTNSDIAAYINSSPNPGTTLAVATHDRMTEEYNNNPSGEYMIRLAVITEEHFLQIVSASYSSTVDLAEKVPELSFYETLLNSRGYNFSTGFIKDPFYRKGKDVLPVIRPITYKFNSIQGGFLFIEISSDLFTDALQRYGAAEDSPVILTIGGHDYLYGGGRLTETEAAWENVKNFSDSATIEGMQVNKVRDSGGISHFAVTAPLNMPDCYITQIISRTELQSQQRILLFLLAGTLLGILGIGTLLMAMLNRMISLPVIKIRDKMQRVSEGDFTRDPSIEWNHELGDIGRGINDLSENVYLLMNRRLEDEKQKKDLEYKMLQSQINPHFLYNTLNSIKWMATIQGADGISEMTTALAKLLKSLSKGTSLLVPVREELSLLRDYFTIQRYRYGGTITLDIHTDDDEISDVPIIKFTLQPLVENAIFHGIEPKGSGHIDIHLYYEDSTDKDAPLNVRIDVTDDGVGMSKEKAAQILVSNSENSADFFREIGVSNVQKRLQYEFGEQYGITVKSEEGRFTTMSILIPGHKAEETIHV